ncbi:hypothetical protein FA09DRAFT_335829 [Tilletiopsis washingtonensis]|uniref:Dolichyl-diphosphooligosaccharide-protein glycosyltransferase subunit OST5 n=1 Tax=Tilletiopsis washingtonensis TaxID=58919 RepID=A0A316ZJA3_9BASI|nr:hypothetical protein FA09DRAFT_335829 [Tilletiopsis washingtonensis]PWO01199.1 hypothetical protein FA09DRAFT_335829 [Tilletiopsis washingtonensis]
MSDATARAQAYAAAQAEHLAAAPFAPALPVAVMPYLAGILLALAFLLSFYFTTLPKGRIALTEIVTAGGASLCIGFGIVALFTTVGVHV